MLVAPAHPSPHPIVRGDHGMAISHSKSRRGGNVYVRVHDTYEHRILAERALGKPLPPGAKVHHVDENERNNAPSNLVICQDQSYHKLLHMRALIVRAGGDPNTTYWCRSCNQPRPRDDFWRRGESRHGKDIGELIPVCRGCNRLQRNQWYSTTKALPLETATCAIPHCGRQFTRIGTRKRYCSDVCRGAGRRLREHAVIATNPDHRGCASCGQRDQEQVE